jgi:hypothetical protein
MGARASTAVVDAGHKRGSVVVTLDARASTAA